MGLLVERAVCAAVLVNWLEQVVVPLWIEVVLCHLVLVAGLGQEPVEQPWRGSLTDDVHHRRDPDIDLTAAVVGGVMDGVRGDLRLVDGRHRHRLLGQLGPSPRELGGVQRWQLDHRHPHLRLLVQQLGNDGLREALTGVLGSAVRGLQGDPPIGHR